MTALVRAGKIQGSFLFHWSLIQEPHFSLAAALRASDTLQLGPFTASLVSQLQAEFCPFSRGEEWWGGLRNQAVHIRGTWPLPWWATLSLKSAGLSPFDLELGPLQPWAGLRSTLVFTTSSRKWWCGKHPTKLTWIKHSFSQYILAHVRQSIVLTGFPAAVPSPLQTQWRRWSSSPRIPWRRSTRPAWRDITTRWVLVLLLSCCTNTAQERRPVPL